MTKSHAGEPSNRKVWSYHINLHVGGRFVTDPNLRYQGGSIHFIEEDLDRICYYDLCDIVKKGLEFNNVARIYYYDPNSSSFNESLRLIFDDMSTIEMLNIGVKYRVIDMYVEHDVDILDVTEEPLLLFGPLTTLFYSNNEAGGRVNEAHVVESAQGVNSGKECGECGNNSQRGDGIEGHEGAGNEGHGGDGIEGHDGARDGGYRDFKAPKQWIKAFQGTHSKCDTVDNNLFEAFNSSIVEARYKSIITMLEEIRVKLITRIVKKRQICSNWKNKYDPLVKKEFEVQKERGVEWLWQLSGIPCKHVCCAIWHDDGDPNDNLDKCYHPGTYMKTYQYALQLINGSHEWKKSGLEVVLPPITRKKPGRQKKGGKLKMNQ
ncbi:hypothetical protein DITRI_Ditri05aG0138800 [Diplodiscus trichospermus]